jgi:hypothetical protein
MAIFSEFFWICNKEMSNNDIGKEIPNNITFEMKSRNHPPHQKKKLYSVFKPLSLIF